MNEKIKEVAKSTLDESKKVASVAAKKSKDIAVVAAKKAKEIAIVGAKETGKFVANSSVRAKQLAQDEYKQIVDKLDVNKNGQIDIEDIIICSFKIPGIKVDRTEFLNKELIKKYPKDVVKKAIDENPLKAGINVDDLDSIADDVIKFERLFVTGISTALATPGGIAMVATIPADLTQYYGYLLRVAQKLLYLYGFPSLELKDEDNAIDSKTMNTLILCLGVMYGIAGTNGALQVLSKALATGVEKKLLDTALTKTAIYPIVKEVAKWFGVKMTKQVFADFVGDVIPVVGGIVGGGITYATFKPCCDRLKKSLKNTMLSNPNYKETENSSKIYAEVIEAEEIKE